MARVEEGRVNDARIKLLLALPKDHPVVRQVDDLLHAMWVELGNNDVVLQHADADQREAIAIVDAHARLRDVLADWRRGIRDWDEVESALKATETILEERMKNAVDGK